jgi:hypothetical protein
MNRQTQQHRNVLPFSPGRFDNTAAVREYAIRFVRHGYVNETEAEAAEQCALDLMDRSAKNKFKAEVRKLLQRQ